MTDQTGQIVGANNSPPTPPDDRQVVKCPKCGNAMAECTGEALFLLCAEIRQAVKIFCRSAGCRGYKLWEPQNKPLLDTGITLEFRRPILADI